MRRLPVAAFGALVLATIGAFFVVQHLKVTTPLIAGFPAPSPAVINPVNGTTCNGVDHRVMKVSFYLQHRSDDVDVYVIDSSGQIVATLASGRHMRRGVRKPDGEFEWDGREDNGSFAPDGQYYIKVALIHQGRSVELSNNSGPEPVTVKTIPPRPVVTAVTPKLTPPPQGRSAISIRYGGNEGLGATVELYRTDVPGRPVDVKHFFNPPNKAPLASWDGRIGGQPAPAGVYLAGLSVQDAACNVGRFPSTIPPAPGSTPHAGVTVRYLAAQPPRYPAPAGSRTLLYVDARQRPYTWTLLRAGVAKPVSNGSARGYALRVRLPGAAAGLYQLDLRSGSHTTAVPLLASAGGRGPNLLVVLPALTWQGQNPGDEDGDGMPDVLDAGVPISLARPLAHGLPAGFGDEQALLAYLDKAHLPYDLTTDLGLVDHVGPQLAGHAAVVFAGTERWIPSSLGTALTSYVQGGGHVVSFGIDAFRRGVTVQRSTALDPTGPAAADVFGARPGGLVGQNPSDLITVITDQLGLFSGTSGALSGFGSYQPFSVAAPGHVVSSAGATSTAPSIVAFRLGRGLVIEVGLPGFGSQLAKNVDAQELVNQMWKVIGG